MGNEGDRLQALEQRIDKHEGRIGSLETRVSVVENEVGNVKADLSEIKDNTKWILRIIIGALVVAVLSYVVKSAPATLKSLQAPAPAVEVR